ncbi:MAG: hypothetical protein ACJ75H_04860 [Thermoanaerobaculia bacterium]
MRVSVRKLLLLLALAASSAAFSGPREATAAFCNSGQTESYVYYYSDSTRTVLIGTCHTNCQGTQTCTGQQSTYVKFALSCCTL